MTPQDLISKYAISGSNQDDTNQMTYRCITKDFLDGFWSEKHGNPLYLGNERCLRYKVANGPTKFKLL